MSGTALTESNLRERIIADPDVILEDRDLMRALVAANERQMGPNIVDLRGLAMERLEARLERLEDTHRSVIAAAYDNLAGTNQVHRAVLALLEPADFAGFLKVLAGDVATSLRVDSVRLVLESTQSTDDPALAPLSEVLCAVRPGFIAGHLGPVHDRRARPVILRQVQEDGATLHGDKTGWIRSEALIRLDLGSGRLPGLLVFGAEDPHQFAPSQGTDLLTFFAGVFERVMRRFLA